MSVSVRGPFGDGPFGDVTFWQQNLSASISVRVCYTFLKNWSDNFDKILESFKVGCDRCVEGFTDYDLNLVAVD